MAKQKTETPKRVVTKRQISHLQQQKRRQRIIRIFGITVIVAVVGLLSYGLYSQWYLKEYKPLKETVVEVNGVKFDNRYFIDYLKIQLGDYSMYVQYFIDTALSNLERDALIKEYAEDLGITASKAEIDAYVTENTLPDNQASRGLAETQVLVKKLQDDHFRPQISTTAEQRHAMAMFLESQKQAEDVIARLNAGEDFATIAGQLSLESTTKTDKGDLGFRPRGIIDGLLVTTVMDEAIFNADVGVLSQPLPDAEKSKNLGYWLVKVVEKNSETGEVHTLGMLLPSQQAAEDAVARLNNGEDFAALAEQISQQGVVGEKADLGFLLGEDVTQPFADYIFDENTQIGVVSAPIADISSPTKGGFWIYKVLEAATMDISTENMDILVSNALSDWVASIVENPDNVITSYLDQTKKDFIIKQIAGY